MANNQWSLNNQWNLKLVSPTGEVFDLGNLSRASSTQEHAYIWDDIRLFLEKSDLTQRDFLLMDLCQMLLNKQFHAYHGYRLAWGGNSPDESHSGYPNGKSLDWQFYRLINGKTVLLLEGALPSNWWEIDEVDRQDLVEEKWADDL